MKNSFYDLINRLFQNNIKNVLVEEESEFIQKEDEKNYKITFDSSDKSAYAFFRLFNINNQIIERIEYNVKKINNFTSVLQSNNYYTNIFSVIENLNKIIDNINKIRLSVDSKIQMHLFSINNYNIDTNLRKFHYIYKLLDVNDGFIPDDLKPDIFQVLIFGIEKVDLFLSIRNKEKDELTDIEKLEIQDLFNRLNNFKYISFISKDMYDVYYCLRKENQIKNSWDLIKYIGKKEYHDYKMRK